MGNTLLLILAIVAVVLIVLFAIGDIHAGAITSASWSVLAIPRLKAKL